jgi:hypothetical protein
VTFNSTLFPLFVHGKKYLWSIARFLELSESEIFYIYSITMITATKRRGLYDQYIKKLYNSVADIYFNSMIVIKFTMQQFIVSIVNVRHAL